MPSPNIFATADKFRAELLRKERAAATEMVKRYGEAWFRMKRQIDALTVKIQEARANGEEPGLSWLFQYERLQLLQRQVEAEIRQFVQFAEQSIVAQQAEAVRAAQSDAEQLMLEGMGPAPAGAFLTFSKLPVDAITNLVGFTSDGSPLRDLLDELGPDASEAVRSGLISGVALGKNPNDIARQIRAALGMNMIRALTISRTEVMRSYREASHQTYLANSDIVKGWIWHSALGPRTCAACWAMHGTVHSLKERLDDHIRGRCSAVPLTKTWEELGFNGVSETQIKVDKGVDLFAKLPDTDKEAILGKAAFLAYKSGAVKLEDFVGRTRDRRWGTMRYAKSLRDILGPKERDRWIKVAAENAKKNKHNSSQPKMKVKPPVSRHRLSDVNQRSRAKEITTVYESWVNVRADIEAINHGEAQREGNNYRVHGRLYGIKPNGTAYPIEGPGLHVLDRGAFRALGVYNIFGLTDESDMILDRMHISQPAREAARKAYLGEREGRKP